MDHSDKNRLLPNTKHSNFRKTPLSRSIKQNGEFLFSKERRKTPITHYIPPHRRNGSIDGSPISSKRSEVRIRTPVKACDQTKISEINGGDNFNREFNGTSLSMQEINRNSLKTQEINRNSVITQETNRENFTPQFNEESIEQRFNGDITQGINKESITEDFYQESHIPSVNKKNINKVVNQEDFIQSSSFNQENITHKFNQDLGQGTISGGNVTQKINQNRIVKKVLKLAKRYMNLEFKQILRDVYYDKYKENLPVECLSAIKFCISLDLDNNYINNFSNAESKSDCRSEEINNLKVLELKDIAEEFWFYIYKCDSFTSIWGVIMDRDHFGKIEELAEQMKIFFQYESKVQKVKVEENSYYAVFDGSWHRVQCIKCNESTAEVYFLDRGDQDNISIHRLFELDPKFFKLPAQAVNVSLSELEIFTDCDDTREMYELLFEKTVYVIVKESNKEKIPCLSVQIYKKEENETINVNELLMKKLFQTDLNPLNYIQEANPKHIEFIQTNETGLFIQLDTKSLKYFKLLMEILIEKHCCDENFKRQKVVRFEENKIYIVKRSRDNKFYRARVLKFKCENVIEVLLIDSGIVTFINREDFFALEKLSSVLAQYPAQAIEVQLDQITVLHSTILGHLHDLTSNSNELYVKFLKSELENNNIPIIRLYKKLQGYLISVNDTILIEHNDILESKQKIISENGKPKLAENNLTIKQKSAQDSFDKLFKDSFLTELERLKQYENELTRSFEEVDCLKLNLSVLLNFPIVPKGSYFDVHVTVAKDPSSFVIQLLKSKSGQLKKMVHEMRTVYMNYGGPKLTYKSIIVGQMYAYKCASNSQMWYRVYLLKIKDKNVATVYYCDYGYYKDVNIDNLIYLQHQFYSLPYQALWAELYGVKPVSSQFWTAEACLRFKELTESKNFVCRVKSIKDVKAINRSKAMPTTVETIYVVKLIDTSTDEDLYIADILINDGQALRKNSNATYKNSRI